MTLEENKKRKVSFLISLAFCGACFLTTGTGAAFAKKGPSDGQGANKYVDVADMSFDSSSGKDKARKEASSVLDKAQENDLLHPVIAISKETKSAPERTFFMLKIESGVGEVLSNKITTAKGALQVVDGTMAQAIYDKGALAQPIINRRDPKHAELFRRAYHYLRAHGPNNYGGVLSELITLRMKTPIPSIVLCDLIHDEQLDLLHASVRKKNPDCPYLDEVDVRVQKNCIQLFGCGDACKLFAAKNPKKTRVGDVIHKAAVRNGINPHQTVDDFFRKNDCPKWVHKMKALRAELVERRLVADVPAKSRTAELVWQDPKLF